MVKNSFLVWENRKKFFDFLKRKFDPIVEKKVEYQVFEKFGINRILFTAEHATIGNVYCEELNRSLKVGDRNTGLVAKIGAFGLRSAYIFPLFSRVEADAARDPKEIGKGLKLFTFVRDSKKKYVHVTIHKNKKFLIYLNHYHDIIEKINPKVIISVHGISGKRKWDIAFGFGKNFEIVGGKKEALNFLLNFQDYLDKIFRKFKIEKFYVMDIFDWRFAASKNFVLTKHVVEFNKKNKEKRFGMQVEINKRERVDEKEKIPTIACQIFIQALGKFVKENYLD